MEDGKTEKMINNDFEPFRPINQSLYNCGNKFDTSLLLLLLHDDQKFGFGSEANTLAADALSNVKFEAEKKLASKFLEDIALDSGLVVFGVENTMKAMEIGALKTMMLFEDLEVTRYVLKNPIKGYQRTLILNPT